MENDSGLKNAALFLSLFIAVGAFVTLATTNSTDVRFLAWNVILGLVGCVAFITVLHIDEILALDWKVLVKKRGFWDTVLFITGLGLITAWAMASDKIIPFDIPNEVASLGTILVLVSSSLFFLHGKTGKSP